MATSDMSAGVADLARELARDKIATTIDINSLKSGKANLASPALTGTPTAPTAAEGTNSTQIATTAFVQTAVQSVSEACLTADGVYAAFAAFNTENGIV